MTPEPAYLLHKRPYRETSALVELLTFHHGRVRAVARGVQRPGSRLRAVLQPFAPLHVTWSGSGDLKRLGLMESRGSAAMLVGEGLLCGLYANELLARLLPVEMPVDDVFAFYAAALDALPQPSGRAVALRRLELSLLEALDAEPRFGGPDGQALESQTRYVFDAASRAFVPGERGIDGRTLKLLATGDWNAAGLAGPAKAVMRAALAPLLGSRPLRSRELMRQLATSRLRRET
ncbi:DNA repair protein RecO [Halomonas elongata]|uniref:DNA repair protein RecO n=2 Tax=Halomonas elongata TaxID=2746 RepID=E1V4G4_HALED|nr:DNA repair protein RecO [Halomonas elongata]MBW5799746.1 DNA repair protein RecO [Halomonas elongata]MDL4862421.1 DNA repair protein RecO [Halomonas elongata]OBX35820.1 DNA repair protein RecO [Halomonas elongata]RAW07434.1 DNA repair protein RecO [Halomonas elongata]WBF16647.1 DNA repair protein RecO [Halomonas elongata]